MKTNLLLFLHGKINNAFKPNRSAVTGLPNKLQVASRPSVIIFLFILLVSNLNGSGQTQLIPAADGGFENGTTTFAANGWTEVQPGNLRQWWVGNAAGSSSGSNSAYVGTSNNNNGTRTTSVQHFYRDIAIPAGAVNVFLDFDFKQTNTDNGNDIFYVFTTTTLNTPVSGTLPGAGYTQRFTNTATAYGSFTAVPTINLSALAGTTVRLVFTFKANNANPAANPAVDDVSLTYAYAPTITSYTPSSGCGLSASITINGTNLSSASAVTIGGTAVSSITSNTATQIVAVIGNGTTGTVSVTTAGGTANGSGSFTVNPSPTAYNVGGGGTYCSTGSGLSVTLSGSQLSYSYQLYIGGSATGSPVIGTGLALNFGLQTAAGTYTVIATNTSTGCTRSQTGSATIVMNTAPSISSNPASIIKCVGYSASFSVTASGTSPTYQWRKNGSNIAGATSSTYTIASVVVGDAGNYDVVVSVSSCSSVTSTVATLTVVAVPNAYNVTGGGTACSTGSGVAVGLSNSQATSTYQLYNGVTAVGSPVTGTGAAISFGNQTSSGTYTVVATHSTGGCTRNQTGSAVVTINTAPSISSNPSSITKCVGYSASFSVTASGTSPTYQWRKNGSNIGGATSSTYTIGSVVVGDAGNYDVVVSVSSCTSVTSAVATLTVVAVPTAYNVTGGGTGCSTTGVAVGLSNSQATATYQLYNGVTSVGSPVTGTGAAISFGNQTSAGTYTVVATHATGGCTRNQTGSAVVVINTAPSISVDPVSQSKCVAQSVTFSVTAAGTSPTYQWRKNGTNISGATSSSYTIASVVAGDAANYDVVVSVSTCSSVTSAAATLTVNSLPTVYNVTGGGSGCTSVTVGLSGSQSGVDYTLSPGGVVVSGTGASISFGGQTTAATYTVSAANTTTGCSSNMSGSAVVTILSAPAVTTQPADQSACSGGSASFTVAASGSGLTYQWKKGTTNISNGGTVSGATTATLTISAVVSGDVASDYNCEVTNSCGNDISDYVSLSIGTIATTPSAQPTTLAFPTIGVTSFVGTFVAGASPTFYLVVRRTSNTTPTSPSDGTTYAVGSSALGVGTYVEYSGADSTFSSNGLSQGTTYYYWVYAYNVGSCGTTPKYYTTSPLTGSATTLTNVSCGSHPTLYWAGTGSLYTNGAATTNFNTATNWSTSAASYVASAAAPTQCDNVDIRTNANVTIALSANASTYGLNFTSENAKLGILHTAGYTLTINGDANIDIYSTGSNNSAVGIGEYSAAGAGIVDFKANVTIGTNAAASNSGKISYFLGNTNSKLIFRADLLLGRTNCIPNSYRPGQVVFDGIGLQEVLWNNNVYFSNFYDVIVGSTNNPIVRHVTGTYTPDNIYNSLTINGSSTLDLATSQWIRDNAGGYFTMNSTSKMILGNDKSIVSPANGRGVVVPGSNFPGGFSTMTIASGTTIEYDADNTLTQTVYATPTYGNLTLTNSSGSGTANKITTATVTISGTSEVKSGVTLTPAAGITTNGNFNVNNGATLVCASYIVSGSGAFNLKSGGTLSIGSNQGITSSGATGNIITTTRSFSTGGNYTYLSTGGTNTGNGLPTTVNDLTISNPSGVTLYAASTDYAVSGILRLTSGQFIINGNTLIVDSLIRSSGSLRGSATSSLTINGANSPLYFAAGGRILKNLSLGTNASGTMLTDIELPGGTNAGTLTIGSGATLTTNSHLILRSTATGSARVAQIPVDGSGNALGFVSGNVQVERYISARRAWRMLSVTTSGSQTINAAWQEGQAANVTNPAGYGIQITGPYYPNGFDLYTLQPSVKIYDPPTGTWSSISGTNIAFTNGVAYMTFIRGDRTVNAFGQAPTSTILRTRGSLITGNQSAVTVNANKFATLANPYASSINFTTVSKSGVDDKFYVWDPYLSTLGGYQTFIKNGSGDYEVVLGGGSYGSAGDVFNEIQNGQAFMVYSTGTSGTISLRESDKSTGNVNASRNALTPVTNNIHQLRTKLYGIAADGTTTLVDGVLNRYSSNFNNSIDNQDAAKGMGFGENLSVKTEGKLLVADSRSEITDTDTIYFNLTGTRVQQYKFQFIPKQMSIPGLTAFFQDSYLQTSVPLNLEDSGYAQFSIQNIPGSYAVNRFRIVFKQTAPVITSVTANRNAFNNLVTVNWTVEHETGIQQYAIQRSADTVNFNNIFNLDPAGNDFATHNYTAEDQAPLHGNCYYRIKAIRNNGPAIYSAIVKLVPGKDQLKEGKNTIIEKAVANNTEAPAVNIFPNPVVNGLINLQFINQVKGAYHLEITNQRGETVYRKNLQLNSSNVLEKISLESSIASGTYQLKITSPDGTSVIKQVIIQ